MRTEHWWVVVACFLLMAMQETVAAPGPPQGKGSYAEFLALFDEFHAAQLSSGWNANFNDPSTPDHGLMDYSGTAIQARLAALAKLRARLEDMNVAAWPREQQSEYLATRALFDQQEFLLRVSRPWARDPGFYVDQLLRFAFTPLPAEGARLERLRQELAAVPGIVATAQRILDDVATDYAVLALHNLRNTDGVGHGHPYRAVPPAGVIGWYEDLLSRARSSQPDLVPAAEQALAAVRDFDGWLERSMPGFRGAAGVGRARYDWYLKHAKLIPHTADQLLLLATMEWERLTAWHAIARHRNRNLPELEPAPTAEEYARRIAATDRNIREFLVREQILTIPPYVGDLDTNAPFIQRPMGLNFWEYVQFRDPHPDHLHAVLPGHRFDGLVEDNDRRPVRGRISDGVRAEGWGVYLEEAMMQAGVLADRPRVDELIYLFGIFRAARVAADVGMQRNEMTVEQAVRHMRDRTPHLDPDVARVDAEIYLRRPPGYGIGYTIGSLQMRKLLADRRWQLGEGFVLRQFHDDFLARGRLPLALLRWEITGLDD
ncbi:MAG: DUF885 domain-containing protein, partial [Steroidobacteraceae bacterium]|nr:DUF885 domain-containing protein [Steroidobacteraceae bacterium]